jgi:hypothetical protein
VLHLRRVLLQRGFELGVLAFGSAERVGDLVDAFAEFLDAAFPVFAESRSSGATESGPMSSMALSAPSILSFAQFTFLLSASMAADVRR